MSVLNTPKTRKSCCPQQVVFRKPADYSKAVVYKCKLADYSKPVAYKCKLADYSKAVVYKCRVGWGGICHAGSSSVCGVCHVRGWGGVCHGRVGWVMQGSVCHRGVGWG